MADFSCRPTVGTVTIILSVLANLLWVLSRGKSLVSGSVHIIGETYETICVSRILKTCPREHLMRQEQLSSGLGSQFP
jgi:hypothetical protein